MNKHWEKNGYYAVAFKLRGSDIRETVRAIECPPGTDAKLSFFMIVESSEDRKSVV